MSALGGPIPDESFEICHDQPGVLGMCNNGHHTAASQFYVTLRASVSLDKSYVAFGRLIDGCAAARYARVRGNRRRCDAFYPLAVVTGLATCDGGCDGGCGGGCAEARALRPAVLTHAARRAVLTHAGRRAHPRAASLCTHDAAVSSICCPHVSHTGVTHLTSRHICCTLIYASHITSHLVCYTLLP